MPCILRHVTLLVLIGAVVSLEIEQKPKKKEEFEPIPELKPELDHEHWKDFKHDDHPEEPEPFKGLFPASQVDDHFDEDFVDDLDMDKNEHDLAQMHYDDIRYDIKLKRAAVLAAKEKNDEEQGEWEKALKELKEAKEKAAADVKHLKHLATDHEKKLKELKKAELSDHEKLEKATKAVESSHEDLLKAKKLLGANQKDLEELEKESKKARKVLEKTEQELKEVEAEEAPLVAKHKEELSKLDKAKKAYEDAQKQYEKELEDVEKLKRDFKLAEARLRSFRNGGDGTVP